LRSISSKPNGIFQLYFHFLFYYACLLFDKSFSATNELGYVMNSGVPRNFVREGGSTNSVEEDRENGDVGAVAP
jgi:hypothetical protein